MLESYFYNDLEKVRFLMNEFGSQRRPFLFGINYEMDEAFFCPCPMGSQLILFSVGDATNAKFVLQRDAQAEFYSNPLSRQDYQFKFDVVHRGLKRGDSFLANLTIKTGITTNLSLAEIFYRSRALFRIYIPGRFVCFSPERFVKISGGEIISHPMKGTISASIVDAEQKILADFKETAEHSTIVDLIRNDLSMVADRVEVRRFRYIDRIQTNRGEDILQVSSEIAGKLPDNYLEQLGDIMIQLLPAGSICGAPKKATVDLIRAAEGETRGFYTGVFGYYDGQTLDSGVMIRYIEEQDGSKFFRSGGGITAYSQWEDEYEEALGKIYLPFA
jgi:para-aminobenzoate synthetase component 1